MRKALAITLPLSIFLLLAGCQNRPEHNTPDLDNPTGLTGSALDAAEIRRVVEASLVQGWKVGRIDDADAPEGWYASGHRGLLLTLIPPQNHNGDSEYVFWIFGANYEGKKRPQPLMTDTPSAFYYNRNDTYVLFFQPDLQDQMSEPLNQVTLALGISEVVGEAKSYTKEQIAQTKERILARFPGGADTYAKSFEIRWITKYTIYIMANTLDEQAADFILGAAGRAYPVMTFVLLRVDGKHQDCIIAYPGK
ncbi:MAG: hypothetical protein ABIH04_09160 [Planctomycetota bacterium]